MLAKRIIPCLDVKDGRVVKGINFLGLVDAGDPVNRAAFYDTEGADEIAFLDINASHENRGTMAKLASETAKKVFIPFTIGGGIRKVSDFREILKQGADKCSINSSAVTNPNLIKEASNLFGSQCIVVAIDVKKTDSNSWEVVIKGGREKTGLDAFDWARKCEDLGAGEILLTSMDSDGTENGYDLEITRLISESLSIPIIASGGAGSPKDIYNALTEGKADAALIASIVHFGKYTIKEIKTYLHEKGVNIRL